MSQENPQGSASSSVFANAPQQLHAHLFYLAAPSLPQESILEALRKRFGEAEAPDPRPGLRLYFFPKLQIPFQEGLVPAQCHLLEGGGKAIDLGRFETARQQSFHFPEAFERLKACRHEVILSDLMSAGLPLKERRGLFAGFVRAVCEVAPPELIYFLHPDRFEAPAEFLAGEEAGDGLSGFVHVRMFRLPESGGYLMDTLGLHAFGLSDFQVFCQREDPAVVAERLFDYADYVLENGPALRHGDRVAGAYPEQPWYCQRKEAMMGPERLVLELGPFP